MKDCLFCKFVSGELSVNKVYEDEDFIIIKDIEPKCKNHYLAIPKSHFKLLSDMTEEQKKVLANILAKIPALSDKLGLCGGYRLVINQGDDAGQSVPHIHIHILSGEKMGWDPAGLNTQKE